MNIRRSILNPRLAAIALVLAAIYATVAFYQRPDHHSAAAGARKVQVHTDHPTYNALNDLVGAADVVFSGTVRSSAPGTNIPGPSGDVAGADAIPQTDYSVEIDQVFKGTRSAGQTLTVTLAGGSSGGTLIEFEGTPDLKNDTQYVFFVSAGSDNKYYALSGGAAIAGKNSDGSFSLPDDVSDSGILSFTTDQLLSVPPPDHVLMMLLSQPLVRIEGDVQSGSISVTRKGASPTRITGTCLVAGRVLTVDITISGKSATGNFDVDDVTYTLQTGVVTPARDDSTSISGKAKSSTGVQEVRLQVFDR
jgi:FlaG/FlaF family flagellin (archaellin)